MLYIWWNSLAVMQQWWDLRYWNLSSLYQFNPVTAVFIPKKHAHATMKQPWPREECKLHQCFQLSQQLACSKLGWLHCNTHASTPTPSMSCTKYLNNAITVNWGLCKPIVRVWDQECLLRMYCSPHPSLRPRNWQWPSDKPILFSPDCSVLDNTAHWPEWQIPPGMSPPSRAGGSWSGGWRTQLLYNIYSSINFFPLWAI